MTRVPWRTFKQKEDVKNKMYPFNKPWDCVSVDQLESRDLGIVAQLKGKLTTSRYKAATVFVDQNSRKEYVFLQKSLKYEEDTVANNANINKYHDIKVTIITESETNKCDSENDLDDNIDE